MLDHLKEAIAYTDSVRPEFVRIWLEPGGFRIEIRQNRTTLSRPVPYATFAAAPYALVTASQLALAEFRKLGAGAAAEAP